VDSDASTQFKLRFQYFLDGAALLNQLWKEENQKYTFKSRRTASVEDLLAFFVDYCNI